MEDDFKLIKILFICHGNICRSPMAQFIMQQLVDEDGCSERYFIDSKATSTEEIGNGIYPQAKKKLTEMNVPLLNHRATQITQKDYDNFDLLIGMDGENIRNMYSVFKDDPDGKIHMLREFSGSDEEVDDPWFTRDFDTCYDQIAQGCQDLFRLLEENL